MRSMVPDSSGSTENDPAQHAPAPTTLEDAVWGPTPIGPEVCADADAGLDAGLGAGVDAGGALGARTGAWQPMPGDGGAHDVQPSVPAGAAWDAVGYGIRERRSGADSAGPAVPAAAPDPLAATRVPARGPGDGADSAPGAEPREWGSREWESRESGSRESGPRESESREAMVEGDDSRGPETGSVPDAAPGSGQGVMARAVPGPDSAAGPKPGGGAEPVAGPDAGPVAGGGVCAAQAPVGAGGDVAVVTGADAGTPVAGAGECGAGIEPGPGQGVVGDELVGADMVWAPPGSVPAVSGIVRERDGGASTARADGDTWWDTTGRRHSVIANETTASIPVHLLFRDDSEQPVRPVGVRRPPVPRAPQAQARAAQAPMQAPTRPAPPADPRLVERPGPVLPGWAALAAGAVGIGAGLVALWESGALPAAVLERLGIGPRPYEGLGIGTWAVLTLLVLVVLFALGGIGRGQVGYASVLTLFGDYRGSVRRTGLIWVSPLLLRRRVDVRLRHWRSEPLPAVDASGAALRVVVLVVWRVRDTVRATLGVADHEVYLREQVEAAMARVLSQLPADAFNEDTHTLRDAEAVGDALTRMLKADCAPVGIDVYSAQPTGIEYAPEVAAAMQRCRVAAIDAKHRDSVLTSVVDAVDDTVNRLTSRGIVQLDDYEHKALVRDLTVAFYTGHGAGDGARGASAAC